MCGVGPLFPGRALNALVLSSGEDSAVIVSIYAADQRLPTGSGAEEGWEVDMLSVCASERQEANLLPCRHSSKCSNTTCEPGSTPWPLLASA